MMRSSFAFVLIFFSLLLTSCQPVPQTAPPTPAEVQPPAQAALPTAAVIQTAPTTETPSELMNIIFSDDGSPDGTTALLYLLADPGAWIDALVISHGEAHPKTYIQHMGRMLADFGITDIPLGQGQD